MKVSPGEKGVPCPCRNPYRYSSPLHSCGLRSWPAGLCAFDHRAESFGDSSRSAKSGLGPGGPVLPKPALRSHVMCGIKKPLVFLANLAMLRSASRRCGISRGSPKWIKYVASTGRGLWPHSRQTGAPGDGLHLNPNLAAGRAEPLAKASHGRPCWF